MRAENRTKRLLAMFCIPSSEAFINSLTDKEIPLQECYHRMKEDHNLRPMVERLPTLMKAPVFTETCWDSRLDVEEIPLVPLIRVGK